MPEKTALILANADLGPLDVISRRVAQASPDLVLAADGGMRHAEVLGLRPTAVVGDLDSLHGSAPAGIQVARHPVAKDETDLELALLHAVALGAGSIVVVGATGGRLDMTLANVLLLLHPALRRVRVEVWAGRQTAFLLRPPGGRIGGEVGDVVSLIPLDGDAAGITTYGLAFPLCADTLHAGPGRGVSNQIREVPARVELGSGALLVVHTPAVVAGEETPK